MSDVPLRRKSRRTLRTAAAQSQDKVPDSNSVSRSVKAIGYKVGGGNTKVDLNGTDLMAQAMGEARVEAKPGATNIEISLKNMTEPSKLGAEFLTYVLWVVTPDGRTGNTGELLINKNGEAKLNATTPAQTFAMLITASHILPCVFPARWLSWKTRPAKAQRDKSSQSMISS